MIALSPTVTQLKGAGFRNVDGVLEYAGLRDAPRALPALYVVPQAESASPNRTNGIVDQRVVAAFMVVLVLSGTVRATDKASEELKLHADAIADALVGWKHPEASGPTEYAGGSLLLAEGNVVAWGLRFTAPYHIRKDRT